MRYVPPLSQANNLLDDSLHSLAQLVLVWEMLLAQTENMSKSSKDRVRKTEIQVFRATMALMFIVLPIMTIGVISVPILKEVGNLFMMLTPSYLVVKGTLYSRKLVKLLSSGGEDTSRARIINTIRKTIRLQCVTVIVALIVSTYCIFLVDKSNESHYQSVMLFFWT